MQTLDKKLCFDKVTEEEAAASLAARSKIIKAITPIIANRLAVVQQRDKLRYAQTRSGAYLPMVRKFSVGDYVYLRRPNQVSTLQIRAQQAVVRVMVIKSNGVVRVQGRCGNTRDTNVSSLAPCHLPHLDGTIDPSLAIISPDLACEVCNFPNDEEFMLLCDYCNLGWHMYCLEPPLTVLPPAKDAWLCPTCLAAGVTLSQLKDAVRDRSKSHLVAPAAELGDTLFKRRTAVADKNAASTLPGDS